MTQEKNDWIAIREPGGIIHWLLGSKENIDKQIENMNSIDETGSTSIHIGPVTEEDARAEFRRLTDI